MKNELFQTDEFKEWLSEQPARSRIQIADRLDKVRDEGYFGDHKWLRGNI